MLPSRNIHIFTGTSPDGKTHNKIDHISIDGRRHSSISNTRSFMVANYGIYHNIWWCIKLGRGWQDVNGRKSLHGRVQSQENIRDRG
jgi:hypothetical protein